MMHRNYYNERTYPYLMQTLNKRCKALQRCHILPKISHYIHAKCDTFTGYATTVDLLF